MHAYEIGVAVGPRLRSLAFCSCPRILAPSLPTVSGSSRSPKGQVPELPVRFIFVKRRYLGYEIRCAFDYPERLNCEFHGLASWRHYGYSSSRLAKRLWLIAWEHPVQVAPSSHPRLIVRWSIASNCGYSQARVRHGKRAHESRLLGMPNPEEQLLSSMNMCTNTRSAR